MTLFTPPNGKVGFAQLRDQFTSMVSDSPVPTDHIAKLPETSALLQKRTTLHLKKSGKQNTQQAPE
jgi:hypothetical protein